jgi:hypothetical protein
MNLRGYAEGKPCMIRLPGFCTHDPDTTVLAHERQAGITGGSQKAPDLLGAWGCHICHGIVDGKIKTDLDRDFVRVCFLEAVIRTQYQLIREGLVKW